jgi:hypothetical protein
MPKNEYTLDDLVNETMFGIKPKKKVTKKIQESKIDLNKIFEADDDKKEKSEDEQDSDKEQENDDASSLDASDATSKESKKKTKKKEIKGDLVMTVSLEISDTDQGKIEIGSKEYASITNISSLLSLYDINVKNLVDPEKTSDTLNLTVSETVSKAENNSITLVMRSNVDDTISINVLVNELGQTFDNIESALVYFNQSYQNSIVNIINKTIRVSE